MFYKKMRLDPSRNYFVTSDTHFWHDFIAGFRNYDSREQMNEDMIRIWNNTVSEDDVVIIIGDVSFGTPAKTEQVLRRLNGEIIVVLGNHDGMIQKKRERFGVETCIYLEILLEEEVDEVDNKVVMMHYPIASWNNMATGSIMLHGHCHGSLKSKFCKGRIQDVGWDVYHKPMNLRGMIATIMNTKKIHVNDHHGRKSIWRRIKGVFGVSEN